MHTEDLVDKLVENLGTYPKSGFGIIGFIPREPRIHGLQLQLFSTIEAPIEEVGRPSVESMSPKNKDDDELYNLLPSWIKTLRELIKEANGRRT